MTLHERFKAERERLGFTQPQIAKLAEVSKTTVINWEKGSSAPPATQLEALSKFGLDVLYVVTGQYAGGAQPAPALTSDESILLEYFRAASPPVKRAALGALIYAAVGGSPSQIIKQAGSEYACAGAAGVSIQTSATE